jgi:CheY-like chemotaxis protein
MTKPRILIVDDDPVNIAILEGMFADAGSTEVLSTTDSREVLLCCRDFCPDLILLDIMMPNLNGFAVLNQLGEAFPGRDVPPVIMLTADSSPATRRAAFSSGASDFMTKPFNHTEALLRITRLLDEHRAAERTDFE